MADARLGWHPEDIKAAVRKKGKTLTALALESGLSECSCRAALSRPLYRAEQAIAHFLGTPAVVLWPDRYDPNGIPRHPRARADQTSSRRNKSQRQKSEAA